MKTYSRLLYTEHEQPHNDDGEGAYTIFSTPQLFGADCVPLGDMSVQKFAVLWEGQPDTRVIDLIEQSIMLTILSPVRLLNASKGLSLYMTANWSERITSCSVFSGRRLRLV